MSGVPKFFQPWITPEKRKNYISGDVTIDATPDHPVLHSKQEDDNENIVSSTTTMASTDSTTLKIPEKYDDSTMSDPDTTDSTSSDVPADYTRMDRQESDTSINGLATSATFSIKNIMKMNQYAPRVTLNMSRIFPPRRSADSTNLGRDPEKYDVGYDDLYPAENLLRPNESSHELPRMSENLIAPTSGEGISSTTIANVDVAGSWLAYSMSPGYYGVPYFPRLHPGAYSQIQPGIQSGVRGIPPVIHPAVLPGFFKHSMEEAVQMVHQQDAAAKQMKKMRPKKFQCQFCEAAFSNNGQLTGHTRIHTGELTIAHLKHYFTVLLIIILSKMLSLRALHT